MEIIKENSQRGLIRQKEAVRIEEEQKQGTTSYWKIIVSI